MATAGAAAGRRAVARAPVARAPAAAPAAPRAPKPRAQPLEPGQKLAVWVMGFITLVVVVILWVVYFAPKGTTPPSPPPGVDSSSSATSPSATKGLSGAEVQARGEKVLGASPTGSVDRFAVNDDANTGRHQCWDGSWTTTKVRSGKDEKFQYVYWKCPPKPAVAAN